ncbi:hypothetical protein V5799_023317 [Amblyomma americanum]|uniref:Uncharacterized protein n=1 Tax=Amblyomma americanum TaxID=6943 RepID=A0AAQ4FHZ9_AMBAM
MRRKPVVNSKRGAQKCSRVHHLPFRLTDPFSFCNRGPQVCASTWPGRLRAARSPCSAAAVMSRRPSAGHASAGTQPRVATGPPSTL